MGWVTAEKQALVATLRTADPDADTLCEGWTTARLLAHLVQREQGPVAMIGDALAHKPAGQEPGLTRLVEQAGSEQGYQDLVSAFVDGPPRWSPMSWAAEQINLVEYVVHHEDIRRGGSEPAEPREIPAGQADAIWKQLPLLARMSVRKAPVGVRLSRPDGRSRTVKQGPGVTLTGEPVELVLWASGRRESAYVEVTGPIEMITAFNGWALSG